MSDDAAVVNAVPLPFTGPDSDVEKVNEQLPDEHGEPVTLMPPTGVIDTPVIVPVGAAQAPSPRRNVLDEHVPDHSP
jgi:hypothetical protein